MENSVHNRVELKEAANEKEVAVSVTANTLVGVVVSIRIIDKGRFP